MVATAFMDAVRELVRRIDASIPAEFDGVISATCVGGVAVHLHSGHRVSDDCEMIFDHKLILPRGLVASYRDDFGEKHALAFDTNYASEIALLHPDATDDAVHIEKIGRISLNALNPTDLAVTKIGRWADVDQADVRALASRRLIVADAVRARVEEALQYYVGDRAGIAYNLRDAIDLIEASGAMPKHGRPI